jgi:tellurite resistance protein
MKDADVIEMRHEASQVLPGDQARWRPRILPNLFGIPFGIAGLADVWDVARPVLGTSPAIANALYLASGAIWLLTLAAYLAQGPRHIAADLRDPVAGPFVSLTVITPMLDAAALGPYALGTAQILVAVFLGLTALIGGWLTGEWISGDYRLDDAHPGYYLPTVAGGLVGAFAAAAVQLHALADIAFGLGVISWLLMHSLVLSRLFFRPSHPPPLIPALAIPVAPPAIAGVAYYFMTGGSTGPLAEGLAGYTILMAVTQLRLIPVYTKLRFSPGFWAFAFSYGAAATDAVAWIAAKNPADAAAYTAVVTALITVFIVAIAVRTAGALARRQLLAATPPTATEATARLTARVTGLDRSASPQ